MTGARASRGDILAHRRAEPANAPGARRRHFTTSTHIPRAERRGAPAARGRDDESRRPGRLPAAAASGRDHRADRFRLQAFAFSPLPEVAFATSIFFGFTSGRFDRLIVSTPSFSSAFACSVSTPSGNVNERENVP